MKKTINAILTVLLIASCAAQSPLNEEQKDALQPVKCKDKNNCDLFWQRAQIWISQNSRWRIQTANDTIIQTYGPGNNDVILAYTVTKIPDSTGSGATITYKANCDNIFGCEVRPIDALVRLKKYIKTGQ